MLASPAPSIVLGRKTTYLYLWTQQGKEREGQIEKVALIYIYIYTIMCKTAVKQITSEKLLYNTGSPVCHSDNLEG